MSLFQNVCAEKPDYGFLLPEGMKAEALSRYPCIQMSDGNILCSADNGDGTFFTSSLERAKYRREKYICWRTDRGCGIDPFG